MEDRTLPFHNEIVQLRGEAVTLNNHRYALKRKMEQAGISGLEIGLAIGFFTLAIDYASEYERDMLLVWYILNQEPSSRIWTIAEVDAALKRSNVNAMHLYSLLENKRGIDVTSRFFDELTGMKLPEIE